MVKHPKSKGTGKGICIISLNAYPMLTGEYLDFTGGGAEKCFVLLAKEIAKKGFEVNFITYNCGGNSIEYVDNIRVIKVYRRNDALHLSLLVKAWYIWNALIKANAAIYIESSGQPGIVSLFCRLRGRKSIYYIASDTDVMKKPIAQNYNFYLSLAHKLTFKLASCFIVQTEFQRKMLSENFGRQSIIIKTPLSLPDKRMSYKRSPSPTLWVAGVRPIKQAELFLELAKAIPEAKFQMIGGPLLGEERYFTSIQEAARGIPNLDFLGLILPNKIGYYFARASILVNTSIAEGFPNTFLEAWVAYTPVVSLNVDPDEVICRHRLGFHSKTFEQMVEDVKTLLDNKALREEMARNARRYVEREHDVEKIVGEHVKILHHLSSKA